MKIFACSHCRHTVFFENVQCLNCQKELGYFPERGMLALPQEGLSKCRNYTEHNVCNWLTRQVGDYCRACRLNRTIPDLSLAGNLQRWWRLEMAKKRLVFSLIELQLPLDDLQFDFLVPGAQPVLTGYSNGLITINAGEADDPTREKMRVDMNEPYRTLLGHFRHESAHHYWTVLVKDLPAFRQVFGDERQDYQQCLDRHYREGPLPDWREQGFISAYASMHPWEDWAESWAHYLHMRDTLQTSSEFGLGRLDTQTFDDMIQDWSRLTFALNSINRSMGISDLYPFVLGKPVLEKLRWIHHLLEGHQR
ncbi:MAG: putative zinc-binding metallopeptidase [Candidatus Eremiobacteraeota bacterium]|nr:putative zinc-binding metallopeptidase [Candidatus Eremiobacteraeota bacterium]MCW5871311.1 putative zinc-binding metallopeptidase [Candidatus Eremiobacteraeota bacterium]